MPLIHRWAGSLHTPHAHKSSPVTDPKITTQLCSPDDSLQALKRINMNIKMITKTLCISCQHKTSNWLLDSMWQLMRETSSYKGTLWASFFWKGTVLTHSPFEVSSGEQYWLSHKSHKRGLKWVTPTLGYQPRNMTQQVCALLGEKRGNLFLRGKLPFSISGQHVATAAACAFQLESDQTAISASRLTSQQSSWE